MKKILIALFVIVSFAFISVERKLTVSLSADDWQSKLNAIEYTKNVLKQSNAPVNIVLPLCDSLTKIQTDLYKQIQQQLEVPEKK